MSRVGICIQARMGSSRLPGKSLMDVGGRPVLARVVDRARQAKGADHVSVATGSAPEDDPIAALCAALDVPCHRGSPTDVLERFTGAVRAFELDHMVRVTGDNPLVGPDVVDALIARHIDAGAGLTTNYYSKSFPNGTVVSVLSREALEDLHARATERRVREHVITDPDMVRERFGVEIVEAPPQWHRYDLRYCVDNRDDLTVVDRLCTAFDEAGTDPSTEEIIAWLDDHPEVRALNEAYAAAGY